MSMNMAATLRPGRLSRRISASLPTSTLRSRVCSPGIRIRGIDRASPPRRKAATFQAAPPPLTSTPQISGSSGRLCGSRACASLMRSRSMNWSSSAAEVSWVQLYDGPEVKRHGGRKPRIGLSGESARSRTSKKRRYGDDDGRTGNLAWVRTLKPAHVSSPRRRLYRPDLYPI